MSAGMCSTSEMRRRQAIEKRAAFASVISAITRGKRLRVQVLNKNLMQAKVTVGKEKFEFFICSHDHFIGVPGPWFAKRKSEHEKFIWYLLRNEVERLHARRRRK